MSSEPKFKEGDFVKAVASWGDWVHFVVEGVMLSNDGVWQYRVGKTWYQEPNVFHYDPGHKAIYKYAYESLFKNVWVESEKYYLSMDDFFRDFKLRRKIHNLLGKGFRSTQIEGSVIKVKIYE